VQQGSWGPPAKGSSKDNLDDIFGKKPVSEPVNVLTPEQVCRTRPAAIPSLLPVNGPFCSCSTASGSMRAKRRDSLVAFSPALGMLTQFGVLQIEWNRKRDAERAQQESETEARMAQWMAEAAAKKAAEGGQ
jgi:hypothetical protein